MHNYFTPASRIVRFMVAGAALVILCLALAGCANGQQCIILVNGNQLCGSAAAAWCSETDSLRSPSSSSQSLCNTIEGDAGTGTSVAGQGGGATSTNFGLPTSTSPY